MPMPFPLPRRDDPKFHLFASSTVVAALVIASIAGLQPFHLTYVPTDPIARSILHVFDPLFLQSLAFVHCWLCIFFWRHSVGSRLSTLIVDLLLTFVAVFGLLIFYYLVNDFIYKPSFNRPRPDESLRLKIGILSSHFSPTSIDGAPSGFASRGTFLLLAACLSCLGKATPLRHLYGIFSSLPLVIAIQSILLSLTCVSRVMSGYHFWFDVLLGIALSVFSFWTIVLMVMQFRDKRTFEESDISNTLIVAIIIGFVIVGFFYSRNADNWAPVVLCTVLVYSLTQIWALSHRYLADRRSASRESEVTKP